MYECEAENQFKVSKAFINIDGTKKKFSFKFNKRQKFFFFRLFLETILFNRTTTLLPKYHRISSSSSSYGRFHYIWQMERRLAL